MTNNNTPLGFNDLDDDLFNVLLHGTDLGSKSNIKPRMIGLEAATLNMQLPQTSGFQSTTMANTFSPVTSKNSGAFPVSGPGSSFDNKMSLNAPMLYNGSEINNSVRLTRDPFGTLPWYSTEQAKLNRNITGNLAPVSTDTLRSSFQNYINNVTATKAWRAGLKNKWPHLTREEINTANPNTTYRSAEAVKATVRVPRNVKISRNTPKSKPISRIIGNKPLFTNYNNSISNVRTNQPFGKNPLNIFPSPVVADTVKFAKIDKPGLFGLPYQHFPKILPEQYDKYHPKSVAPKSNVDLYSRRQLDANRFHIPKEQIDADVAKQAEDFTNNRRKNMPFIKSMFAKRYDPRADELTAAYSGFKTNLFDKPVLDAEGNSVVRPQETIFPPDKRVPVLDWQGNPIVIHSGQTITTTTGRRFDKVTGNLHGAKTPWLDQRTSPITGLAGIQEDVLKSQLPEQLRGVSNLQNEEDLFKFRAAYDQDLINDRLGKKANYANLTDDDIFQPHVRGVDLNNGEMFKSGNVAGGYGWAEHRMHSGTWTNLNPRSLKYGYGMGWGNAWRASSADHLRRGVAVVNPLSRGNLSAMGEMLGRVTTRDRLNFQANPNMWNRLTNVLPSAAVAGLLGYGMMEMQDPGELMTNWIAPAAAIYGGRLGVALGGALTPAKTAANWGLLRGAGLAVGPTLGFVAGLTAASLVGMGISSSVSNDSSIRKFANSINKIEIYSPQIDNRQTLTARQQALNKLSKSGLNDRALLLGNEAAALRGLI